jgi:hypothetical protein
MFKMWTYAYTVKVNICNEACFLVKVLVYKIMSFICLSLSIQRILFIHPGHLTIMGFTVQNLSICTAISLCMHIHKVSMLAAVYYFAPINASSCQYVVPGQ